MAKTESSKNPEFWGAYVHEIRDVLVASVMAQKNCVLLSAPGWGKTRIAKRMSEEIAGIDNRIFKRLEGSTPPQVVKGMIDPAKALESPPKFVTITDGTPYDPSANIVVLDEIFRPPDPVFDALVDILDRHDVNPDEAPVVWGTSNFVVKNQRTNAVVDRIALWLWVSPQSIDVGEFVKQISHRKRGVDLAIPTNGKPFPTWEDVLRIRGYEPDDDTIDMIISILTTLSAEAKKEAFDVNPRRLTHWFDILYRYSAWLADSDNFTAIPAQASMILRYAYPTLTEESWRKWDEVARSIADPLSSALESATDQAYSAFKDIMNKKDKMTASETALELGKVLAQVQSTLKSLEKSYGTDQRINKQITEISKTYSTILNGEDPFKV